MTGIEGGDMKLTKKQRVELIGKTCVISSVYHNKPDWLIKQIKDRPGWITGFGVIRKGYAENMGYDEGVVFQQTEAISVVKVRFWVNEKEFSIPFGGYVLDETAVPFSSQSQYSAERKASYAAQVECYPRDSKGRFV